MCGSASSGSSSGTICQPALSGTLPESWTHTTGTFSRRALVTRVAMFETTESRSCIPATTSVWTSTTRSALFGRSTKLLTVGARSAASVDPREPRREQRRAEVHGGRGVERLEQALHRRDVVLVCADVAAQDGPERGRAHLPSRRVEQVAALDVDLLVVAGGGVLVDRAVERRRGTSAAALRA